MYHLEPVKGQTDFEQSQAGSWYFFYNHLVMVSTAEKSNLVWNEF